VQLKRAADCVDDCVALVDINEPGWRILYVNAAWEKIMGELLSGSSRWPLSRVPVGAGLSLAQVLL